MAASVYTITTSLLPGVQLDVEQAELERLQELGAVTDVIAVNVPADRVVITDGEIPPTPAVGTVWFDRSMP
jgi:hypothetical protein